LSDKHYVPTDKNKKIKKIPSSAQSAYIKKWKFKQQIFHTRKTACCLTGRHKVTHLCNSISANSVSYVWRTEMHTRYWWGQLIDRGQLEDMCMGARKLTGILKQQNMRVRL